MLVLLDGCEGVFHGLVAERVDRRHEEVESIEQSLAVLGQRALGLGVVNKLLLKLRRFLKKKITKLQDCNF